jgi:hypothetical protein
VDWVDVLRLLAIIGMAIGAWESYRKLPPKTVLNGKRYYRQPDGRFTSIWGRRVKDPAVAAELERLYQQRMTQVQEPQAPAR